MEGAMHKPAPPPTPEDVRLRLLRAGFSPIPVHGKEPPLPKWTQIETNPGEIRLWTKTLPHAVNTGILTRRAPAFDIDIRNPEAAEAVEQLVRERFEGEGILVRFGERPKRAIPFRTDKPFKKLSRTFELPPGDPKAKPDQLEFPCEGQQLVVHGIHPDTKQPYAWYGGEPGEVKYDELPLIDEAGARRLVDEATALLVDKYGYVLDTKSAGKQGGRLPAEKLEAACEALRNAAPGTRDAIIGQHVLTIGSIAAGGGLDPDAALAALLEAGAALGDDNLKKIRIAFETGMKSPRRPTVQLSKDRLAEITDEVQGLLFGTGLYQRGGKIVRPGFVQAVDRKGRDILIPGIVTLNAHQLRTHITKHISFHQINVRTKGFVAADYSLEYTHALLHLGDQLIFPLLKAVVTTPVVFADGRVLQRPGYDIGSKLFYEPLGVDFPPVPDRPTKEDALAALDDLKQPLREYPFKTRDGESGEVNVAQSVALSYLITIVNRPAFPVVPGHAFSGNNPGVGKGKLVAIGSILATGTTPAVVNQGAKDEEFEKKLSTRMLSGVSHIAVDNAERTLRGDLLDQVISEDTVFIRILGKLEGLNVPNTFTATATGNKLIFSGDAIRRWLQGDIESPQERPELAEFTFEPLEEARDNRAKLVVAALTIVKAYIVAGRPNKPRSFGSFEEWSDMVRGALIWLGEPDPVKSVEIVRANDPKKNLEARVLELWAETYQGQTRTVAQILKDIRPKPATAYESRPEDHPFREIVIEAVGSDSDSRRLGRFLLKLSDKVIEGKILRAVGVIHGVTIWKVEAVDLFAQGQKGG
jgi:hypothetical protein